MAEMVQKIVELTDLPSTTHWFCPRNAEDDEVGLYYHEDCLDLLPIETSQQTATRLARVAEAVQRRQEALDACTILAFDGSDAEAYQKRLKDALKSQLTRCDICIREFHRSRKELHTKLEASYHPEEVRSFLQKFDAMNIQRISDGLNTATESLVDLEPERRTVAACGDVGMYALFEALNCLPFLCDEEALRRYFDTPFRLVQTKKKLKLPTYAPGMAAFLFSSVESRSTWAHRNFANIKRPLTRLEFEHNVKEFLEGAASRVNILNLDAHFLPTFWKAIRLIISKLTKELVMNHLRTMELNLYTLAMEHWQLDQGQFTDMVMSFRMLLELSPNDFWDAMSGINAQHVVENILNSPAFQKMCRTTVECEPLRLEEKMEWVLPFVRSIKPVNLVSPSGALLDQLLHRFQKGEYSNYAKSVTWTTGLTALLEIMRRVQVLGGGPVVVHLLQVIAKQHIQLVLQELDGIEKKQDVQIEHTEQLTLDILETALALDVQSLRHSRDVILKNNPIEHEIGISGLDIWKTGMRKVRPGHPALPTAIVSGITGLLPLEHFTERQLKAAPKQTEAWNQALSRLLILVKKDLLDALESFTPDQLFDLFAEQKAARGMMALLFNGEGFVHQATLDIFKALSGEDNRRDTIMHLVRTFFATNLTAVASAQSTIARAGAFAPATILLKLSADAYGCLCDTEDGLLRAKSLEDEDELKALELFWQMTWSALETIFRQTEPWSNLGHNKDTMMDFCRETMDLADMVFDQYSIIATILRHSAGEGSPKEVGKQLLKYPTATFNNITKWLRLRDDYLISKAVSLTRKILIRLEEVGIRIDEKAEQFVISVVTSDSAVKTKLSMNQKAELQRALEKHIGEELEADIIEARQPKKQSTLTGWTTPGGSSSGRTTPVGGVKLPKSGVIDVDAWSAKSAADKERREHDKAYADLIAGASKGTATLRQMQAKKTTPGMQKVAQKHQEDRAGFLQRRKQEMEAAKQARAASLAKSKLGAGSGVDGLGDMGKDHSLKGQNVMVSSDEEGEEDDIDDDLFGRNKNKEQKKIDRPNVDPNSAVGLRLEIRKGPTRIQRTQRSVKDMRARLAPDLQPLHRVILKWDFFHDGDYPPGAIPHIFQEVRNSYSDPISYQETFEPLLTLEAWQGMVRSREENTAKPYQVKVQNRGNVDNYIEISSIVSHVENRELSLQEGDIILLSKAARPSDDAAAPYCLARIHKMKRPKQHVEVIYHLLPGSSIAPSLTPQAQIFGLKIQSITPLEREYGALKALQYYDLCTQIIKAAPSKRIRFSEKQVQQFQDVWNVNRAQSEAINAAMENDGFSLIQGPPGSGKTKTIIAIVGGLLSQTLGSSTNGTKKISIPSAYSVQAANSGDAPVRKLLVCAPSNAAVDELVMRLKQGVKTKSGRHHAINVVRIGRSDAINANVIDVTIDELVAKRTGNNNDEKTRAQNAELFKEHQSVSGVLQELYEKRNKGDIKGKELTNVENEIVSVRRRKNELGVRIDKVKDDERNSGREAEISKKRAQQAVLDEAHVICATLSGSGHDMFQGLNIEFETVIIDEAAQCVEMNSIIPLKYGCVKCIMVGDPKQLPPTVFSKEAAKFQYEQSLFVRMQNNFPDEVHLLDTQYRMHPDISVFPSRTFYDGLLKDGKDMTSLRQRPWHVSALLAPYRFFDVQGQHQAAPKGHSLINIAEIEVAMALYQRLTHDFGDFEYGGPIGIITPYKSQLRMLKDRFSSRFGPDIFDAIEFNTTDAFQGREAEIIIFSCVRASPAGGIGFLQDIRRMNVGLTRAKSSLWVLGNSESLSRGQFCRKLVEDARARDSYTTGNLLGMLNQPSSAFPASTAKNHSMYDVYSHVPQMDVGNKSKAPCTGDPGRPLESISNNRDPRKSATPATHTLAPDSNKIDGIRYRFEARVSKKRPDSSERGSDGRSSSHPLEDEISENGYKNVEMEDADAVQDAQSITSGTATPHNGTVPLLEGSRSRAETPLSAASGSEEKSSNRVNGPVRLKRSVISTVPQGIKKRPTASPFMPTKKKPKPGR